ncbi:hypothetical protein MCP1_370006 [Candidatus Terasakiella magnetica]|nr:hypothetical protein MCP1_370006 [Candidatus Terasakiella magnetica]
MLLALNLCTSPKMVHRHYGHDNTRSRASEFTDVWLTKEEGWGITVPGAPPSFPAGADAMATALVKGRPYAAACTVTTTNEDGGTVRH